MIPMNRGYPVLSSTVNNKTMKNFNSTNTASIPIQKMTNVEMVFIYDIFFVFYILFNFLIKKNKLEIPKEVYIIIRIVDVIEKCFNLEKISNEEYQSQMGKLLQRYQNLTSKIRDFNLQNFLQVVF